MQIAALIFSLFATAAVLLASYRSHGSDSRITTTALVLLLVFPILGFLPKWNILPSNESAATSGTSLIPWLSLIITTILGLRLIVSMVRLSHWRNLSESCGEVLVDGRTIELRTLPRLQGPCAAGIIRPVIFLPTSWKNWSPAMRDMVMTHEMTHHARRDPLWRCLASLACALHWFNPLAWWLAHRHALQSEIACDTAVIDSGVDAATYSHALCDLAEATPLPMAASMSARSLKTRVKQMMKPAKSKSRPAWASIIALIALALGTAVCRKAAPETEAFDKVEVETRLNANPFPGNP